MKTRLTDPRGNQRDRRAVAVLGGVVFLTVLSVGAAGVIAVWRVLGVAGVV